MAAVEAHPPAPQEPLPSTDEISSKYETPAPESFVSFAALKERIRQHYELCSEYYYSLWGEHIHHGYFLTPTDTKDLAQVQLMDLLLTRSQLPPSSTVLDVGCGIGGTTRYLAQKHSCTVTGITISGRQVEMAKSLTAKVASASPEPQSGANASDNEKAGAEPFYDVGNGKARYIELDAEKMGDFFTTPPNEERFDGVWISEAMSHLPDKRLFFENAAKVLNEGGKLAVADWFRAEGLGQAEVEADIKPIEDGMLLPPLCTFSEYVGFAEKAGFEVLAETLDISKEVAKTWDLSWSLVQSPSLWAMALTQGRDFIAFLQSFRAMRRGYANGTFRYAVIVFRKK